MTERSARHRRDPSDENPTDELWLFGYGSLIWRPGFDYDARVRGVIYGWSRRLWQASSDHRGVPERPGRVVTLVEQPDGEVWGVAYRVSRADSEGVLAELDFREKNGYERHVLEFHTKDREFSGTLNVLTYIAGPHNEHYLGQAPVEVIAAQVRDATGPSGHNAEYVLRLADALHELNVVDEHVFQIANLVSDTHPDEE